MKTVYMFSLLFSLFLIPQLLLQHIIPKRKTSCSMCVCGFIYTIIYIVLQNQLWCYMYFVCMTFYMRSTRNIHAQTGMNMVYQYM